MGAGSGPIDINLLVVDNAVFARWMQTTLFYLLFFDWIITLHLTHSTINGFQELQLGKRGGCGIKHADDKFYTRTV